ncbi:hypothetical protein [Granulicella sp. 5B5]|nr:hypothetical protein [Granulicella sp. 5B5]
MPKETVPKGTIALQLTMAQPACGKQEDDARKTAYAMQPRADQ